MHNNQGRQEKTLTRLLGTKRNRPYILNLVSQKWERRNGKYHVIHIALSDILGRYKALLAT